MKARWDIEKVKEVLNPDEVARLRSQGWVVLSVRTAGIAEAGIPHQNLIYRMGQPRKFEQTRRYLRAS